MPAEMVVILAWAWLIPVIVAVIWGSSPMRLLARWRCHKTLWCCQYTDQPMCNSREDPHRLARYRYRRQQRRAIRESRGALVSAPFGNGQKVTQRSRGYRCTRAPVPPPLLI